MSSFRCGFVRVMLAGAMVLILPGATIAVAETGADAVGKTNLLLVLSLKDGSRVIGATAATTFRMKASFATLNVPLSTISDVAVDSVSEKASMVLNNDDRISGVLEEPEFDLTTVFGRVSVPAQFVIRIEVQDQGLNRDWSAKKQVLYYSFDTAEDTKIKDDSGNGNDGDNQGCVFVTDGKRRGGLRLNGTTAFANVGKGAAKEIPTWENYTISVWFMNDGKGDHSHGYGQKIIDKTVMYHDFYLCVLPEGALYFVTAVPGASGSMTDNKHDYRDGKWHHAVVVKKGSHGELWVDGTMKSSCETMQQVRNDTPLLLGYSQSTDDYQRKHWSGRMDELRIFSVALGGGDIKALSR